MQAPTSNPITQKKHGPYSAVDYSSSPDVYFYAPENGSITGINKNNGDCGYSMYLNGATGKSGFCHMEECYVKNNELVVRGQKIGKMGYTGYTEPAGPAGRHLHQTLYRNGVFVYPPDYINESFKKEADVSNSIDILRIVAGEVEGMDKSVYNGAYDKQLQDAWGEKPIEDFIRHGYQVSNKKRYQLVDELAAATAGSKVLPKGKYIVQ